MVVYAFMIYKKESMSEGFLAIAFVGIVFAVSWTIASMLTKPAVHLRVVRPVVLAAAGFMDLAGCEKGDQPRYNLTSHSHQRRGCILLFIFSCQAKGAIEERRLPF